jgi:Spy/CpxP family protein refolding chaperone
VKRFAPVLILLVAVALVAVCSCWLTGYYLRGRLPADHVEAHHWIHAQLGLTAQQETELVPIEKRFDEQKRHFGEMLRIANMELAQAIREDRSNSARVTAAVAKIHQAQGELQNATLQHIFEMKPVLKPEQYDKLIQLTADALYHAEKHE